MTEKSWRPTPAVESHAQEEDELQSEQDVVAGSDLNADRWVMSDRALTMLLILAGVGDCSSNSNEARTDSLQSTTRDPFCVVAPRSFVGLDVRG
jgi:hypothetical protein